VAIFRCGRVGGGALGGGAVRLDLLVRGARPGDLLGVRRDPQGARLAVKDDLGLARQVEHLRAGAHHSRQPQRAGQDGRVRVWPAHGGTEAQHQRGVQGRSLRRRQIIGDQDKGLGWQAGRLRGCIDQQAQHALAHIADVDRPLGQQRVAQPGQLGGALVDHRLPCCCGALVLADPRMDKIEQIGVGHDLAMHLEDRRLALGRLLEQPLA
jgi:hypothetical protein